MVLSAVARLNFFLKERNIKQNDIVARTRMTSGGISTIFSGKSKVTYQFALSLQAIYHLNPEWVLHGTKPMYLPPDLNFLPDKTAQLIKTFEKLPDERKSRIIHSAAKEEEAHQKELLQKAAEELEPESKTKIPLVGEVSAGVPVYAEENIQGYLEYSEKVVGDGKDFFFLKVRGDSMIECGIFNGDHLLVRKNVHFNNGEIVIARIEDEAVVKKIRLVHETEEIELIPCNSNYKTLTYRANEVAIEGVVIARVANERLTNTGWEQF